MALPATESYSGASADLSDPPWTLYRTTQVKTDGSGNGTPSANNSDALKYWNADTFGNDQYSKYLAKFNGSGTGAGYCYLLARASGTFSSGNAYWFWSDGGSDTAIYKNISGTLTVLGTANSTTFVTNDELKIDCSGTTISAYKNGSSIISQTDSAIASGAAGMGGWGVSGTVLFDTWEGGNVSAGGGSVFNPYFYRSIGGINV